MVENHFYNDYLVYSAFLITCTSLPLSFFVLWKNPRDPVHRYFSLFGICVAGWAALMGSFIVSSDPQTALRLSRDSNLVALFIYIFFYHYVHALLNLPYRKFLAAGYILTLATAAVSLLVPDLWIDRLNENYLGVRYYTHGAWLYGLHPILGVLFPGFALLTLFQRYRRSRDEWRKKCLLMLIATGMGFLGGFTTYFMVFDIPLFPWGVPLVALYPPLLSYAIIRYRLINIQTMIHKTFLWVVLSSLILLPLYGVVKLTRPWLEILPAWGIALFALGLFYITALYYRTIQPRIDHLFQRRKYDLQQVLDLLLQRMALLGDVRELSRQITKTLVETLYADHATLLLLDEPSRCYRPFESTGAAPDIRLLPDDPFIEWIRRRPEVMEAETAKQAAPSADAKEAAADFFTYSRTAVCVPLVTGREFVGLICLGPRTNLKSYNELDLTFLDKLRMESAIALSNALLYDRVMRLNTELTGLNARLEINVRDRTAELEAANRQLSESNRTITAASRAKTQFLANISHELRTPLNSIIGFSRILLKGLEGPLTDRQREDLEAVYHSGTHLLGLINDLLDLTKIEAGKMDLAFETVDLRDVIRGVMSTAQALLNGKVVDLKTQMNSRLPVVYGDRMRLRQVILNLVSNAVKFTDRGEVEVQAEERGSFVVVSVRDTGCGIRPEDQAHLFKEFQQLDGHTARQRGGTGLGLVISKRLVQLHGGELWVESHHGEGSTFSFSLPVKKYNDPLVASDPFSRPQ